MSKNFRSTEPGNDYSKLSDTNEANCATFEEQIAVNNGSSCIALGKSWLTQERPTLLQLKRLLSSDELDAAESLLQSGGVEKLCEAMGTSSARGLSDEQEDILMRRQQYGENSIPAKGSDSYCSLILRAFNDVTLLLLTAASAVSIALSVYRPTTVSSDSLIRRFAVQFDDPYSWVEGVATLLAVIATANAMAWNDWQRDKQFRALQSKLQSDAQCLVTRNGKCKQLPKTDIVVGDVCPIKQGDVLPADGVLLYGNEVKIDQSPLTGEGKLVAKSTLGDVLLFGGTRVMEGSGRMLVLAVGVHSKSGNLFMLISHTTSQDESLVETDDNTNTQVQLKDDQGDRDKRLTGNLLRQSLQRISAWLGICALVIAVLVFLILSIRFLVQFFAIHHATWQNAYIRVFTDYLVNSIVIMIVAVPEGLPVAVTIALAYSVRRMLHDNNLVRHLYACSTMGNATTICTDKTGTLTTNRMVVVSTYVCGSYLTDRACTIDDVHASLRSILCDAICVNCSYTSCILKSPVAGGLPLQMGNKTECALLAFVQCLGRDYEEIRKRHPESGLYKVYPFSSFRQTMSTVVREQDGSGFTMYIKGAPEKVLGYCTAKYDACGQLVALGESERSDLMTRVVGHMASKCLRTIAVAIRHFVVEPDWNDDASLFSQMTCLAVFGIEDHVRPEASQAIEACYKAGVKVCMVTGDSLYTATSVAYKCGILGRGTTQGQEEELVLESETFNRRIRDESGSVSQSLFDNLWVHLKVLARATPQDKHLLVKLIKCSSVSATGEVVAVTGDGTNDGPALRAADVGFAMGIAGTDVAKEASDIILTDDNFNSIVLAIKWGRNVHDSIVKFVQFQLTLNIVAVTVAVVGSTVLSSSPLQALEMLWVNMLMDTLAALSLATEKPTDELLKRKPYGRNDPIINWLMAFKIGAMASYQLAVTFALIFGGAQLLDIDSNIMRYPEGDLRISAHGPTQHFTFVFNVFVMMSLFNEINCRKVHTERNVFSNLSGDYVFLFIWLTSAVIQAIIVQFGGIVFICAPLTADQWMWSILFGVSCLLWYQIIITFPVLYSRCKRKKSRPAKNYGFHGVSETIRLLE